MARRVQAGDSESGGEGVSPLFAGYISAYRRTVKRRRLFEEVTIATPHATYITPAGSLAEAQADAYVCAVQQWPAAEGWQDHVAEVDEVPIEMIRMAAQAKGG